MQKMRALLKFLFLLVLIAVIGGRRVVLGRADGGPTIEIRQPGKFIGQTSSLELMVQAPGGTFSRLDVAARAERQDSSRSLR